MNIKEYISSGILEQYVLGMLSAEECQEVDQMIQQHPELKTEVIQIEKALQSFASQQGLTTSPGLEQKILHQIGNTPQIGTTPTSTIATPSTSSSKGWLYGMAAILIGLAGVCLWMYNQWQDTARLQAQQQTTFNQLQEDCNTKDETIDQLNSRLEILLNPDNRKINLLGSDNAPQALATVYYNTNDQKTFLNIGNLTQPPADRFYQLWALVDGAPVDMGEFEITANGDTLLLEVPYIENAGAFAITLEERDGDPAPNLAALQVIGNT